MNESLPQLMASLICERDVATISRNETSGVSPVNFLYLADLW